nr:uncharacterized protein LOC129278770 [Lytechinus pictus]
MAQPFHTHIWKCYVNETDFVSGFASFPRALVVDEEQGFLYWSTKSKIERILLNGTGIPETVYHDVLKPVINGLSIDLSRMPRRIFFCYPHLNDSFYKDLTMPLDLYSASHLSELRTFLTPTTRKRWGKHSLILLTSTTPSTGREAVYKASFS